MARRIPHVADGALYVIEAPGGPEITVGSPSWIGWLRDPATRSFSFRSPSGTFTARKEHRVHGDEYWSAYRKRGGRLRKVYLGKAEKLTLERLEDAAAGWPAAMTMSRRAQLQRWLSMRPRLCLLMRLQRPAPQQLTTIRGSAHVIALAVIRCC